MPSPRPNRTETTEGSTSINGRGAAVMPEEQKRPRTVPDMKAALAEVGGVTGGNGSGPSGVVSSKKVMTKVLINVTIQGSVGGVHVLVSPSNTVDELISAVVKQFIKEGRRPLILVKDVAEFDLHYSQFSLESLDREEKLATLGSRNFLLCKRRKAVSADASNGDCTDGGSISSSCLEKAKRGTKLSSPNPWLKFNESLNFKRR